MGYKKKGLDPLKIVGITTLDVVRANKFVGEITGKNPNYINVPVIGGHAGTTIMPVFSQDKASATIDKDKIPDLDKHVQNAGTDVVEAKRRQRQRHSLDGLCRCKVRQGCPGRAQWEEAHRVCILQVLRHRLALFHSEGG